MGLFFYYKSIKTVGIANIPLNKPVLFLSNHQNALLDVLLIATRTKRKLWYLARADVFKNGLLRPLFRFLQMLPVYRIRDGRAALVQNGATFKTSAELLLNNEAILLFPEANHNLKRRVRPLSKGFTRIIFKALEADPNLDLQLVPIGQNYRRATDVGDSACIYFGEPISVQQWLKTDTNGTITTIKTLVAEHLKLLTTHIEDEALYEQSVTYLQAKGADYLNPTEVNGLLQKGTDSSKEPYKNEVSRTNVWRWLLVMINLPIVFIWRTLVKPKVPEPEFMATFRFGFSLLAFPLFYGLVLVLLSQLFEIKTACLLVLGHAVLNVILLRLKK